jgi:hypothetical protein
VEYVKIGTEFIEETQRKAYRKGKVKKRKAKEQ